MYKLSLVLLCTYFYLQCQAMTEELEKIFDECTAEAKIEKKVILKIVETLELPDVPEYKDFLFCSYKKQGYQTVDGKISPSGLKDFLRNYYKGPAVESIVDSCVGNCEDCSPGETAFAAVKCILKKIIEHEETLETSEKLVT